MSVYRTGVGAYRDTTKWLAAFVPITTLVAGLALTGPQLICSAQAAHSAASWAVDHWGVILGVLALLVAVGAILWSASRVLSTEPSDLADLVDSPKHSTALATAIGSGVMMPEFFTKEEFDLARGVLANAWDQDTALSADDPRLTRMRVATESLREWALFREIRTPFAVFRRVFIVAVGVIVTATIYIAFALGAALPVSEIAKVTVRVSAAGAQDLQTLTGCTDPGQSEFLAIRTPTACTM